MTYFYNGTAQVWDMTSSVKDIPGSGAGRIQPKVLQPDTQTNVTDAEQLANHLKIWTNYGLVDHGGVSSPTTFMGRSQQANPISNVGRQIRIV